jgi:PHD/YefM family antitoxin component YafN of YafNO toxin-antitoxin module
MESLEETLEILSDKEAMRNIRTAQKDVKEGRVCSWEDALKELSIDEKDL